MHLNDMIRQTVKDNVPLRTSTQTSDTNEETLVHGTHLFRGRLLVPAIANNNICTLPAKPGHNALKTALLACGKYAVWVNMSSQA